MFQRLHSVISSLLILMMAIPPATIAQTPGAGGALTANAVISGINALQPMLFPNGGAPLVPQFNTQTATLNQQLANCRIQAGLETVGGLAQALLKTKPVVPKTSSSSTGAKTTSACLVKKESASCGLDPKPAISLEPVCSSYLGAGITPPGTAYKPDKEYSKKEGAGGKLLIDLHREEMDCYASFLDWKAENCTKKALNEFKKENRALQCQMAILKSAMAIAGQQLQSSMSANQQKYQKMVQTENELHEQNTQIMEILGGDPELGKSGSKQSMGLIGLQAQLQQKLNTYRGNSSKMSATIQDIREARDRNEQNLKAQSMAVVGGCFKGENRMTDRSGNALLCYKPRMIAAPNAGGGAGAGGAQASVQARDRNGNPIFDKMPCGPIEWVRSQLVQKAYQTGKGGTYQRGSENDDRAIRNGAVFDSAVSSMMRDLGDYDPSYDANGQASQNGGFKGRTRIEDLNGFVNRYGPALKVLSTKVGKDVYSDILKIGQQCFREAETWRNQQSSSATSPYRKERVRIEQTQTSAMNQMRTDLSELNQDYSDVMAAMSGQHIALNRFQCAQGNTFDQKLTNMQSCSDSIQNNLQDLMEGNSNFTFTTKQITGGSVTKPFPITCKGLNGCITALTQVRDAQRKGMGMIRKSRQGWATDANAAVQNQMTQLGGTLSTIQASILQQYEVMKGKLADMGVSGEVPESPNMMTAETFEPVEGKLYDGSSEPGPFKAPKDLNAVLAGTMSGGLIDLKNPGLKDAMAAAEKKGEEEKTKAAEKAEKARDAAGKLASIVGELDDACGKGTLVEKGAKPATVGNAKCENCDEKIRACLNQVAPTGTPVPDNTKPLDGNNLIFMNALAEAAALALNNGELKIELASEVKTALNGLKNDICKGVYSSCSHCIVGGKDAKSKITIDKDGKVDVAK